MKTNHYPFELTPLPYSYNALEPHFDEETMHIHHTKHHQTYVDKLNVALKDQPQLHNLSVEELLRTPDRLPENIRNDIRNNGGGHLNHHLFWTLIAPPQNSDESTDKLSVVPKGKLLEAINSNFGSVDGLRAKFNEVAAKHFASGWTFLIANSRKQTLEIASLPNHQCVLGLHETVLLICDVWEHAYYLKNQNRRPEYLESWWAVVNWTAAAARFEQSAQDSAKNLTKGSASIPA